MSWRIHSILCLTFRPPSIVGNPLNQSVFVRNQRGSGVATKMSLIAGCSEVSSEKDFYEDADKYWKGVKPNVNGMLGGYSQICGVDILGSKQFIREFIQGPKPRLQLKRALDCGAGIGRISKLFLLQKFETVDLLEQNEQFLKQAPIYLGAQLSARVGEYICSGMQGVTLKDNHYDLIWIQWVTGHLTDVHFVEFLLKCQKALKPGGLVILKDNIASESVEWDQVDSSVTRNRHEFLSIFKEARMKIVKEEHQSNFPSELYKVLMFALCEDKAES